MTNSHFCWFSKRKQPSIFCHGSWASSCLLAFSVNKTSQGKWTATKLTSFCLCVHTLKLHGYECVHAHACACHPLCCLYNARFLENWTSLISSRASLVLFSTEKHRAADLSWTFFLNAAQKEIPLGTHSSLTPDFILFDQAHAPRLHYYHNYKKYNQHGKHLAFLSLLKWFRKHVSLNCTNTEDSALAHDHQAISLLLDCCTDGWSRE